MVARASSCVRRVGDGARKLEVAFHRFLSNRRVTVDRLLDGWGERTALAAYGRHVLAIQDTSEIVIKTLPGRRRGLGKVAVGRGRGFLLHAMLALDAAGDTCLGLVAGAIWNRPKRVASPHSKRTLREKESKRWLETGEKAKDVLAAATCITVIGDRESDIYAVWVYLPDERTHLIARVMHDRAITGETTLYRFSETLEAADTRTITLKGDRSQRNARLTLRYAPVAIQRPKNTLEPDLPGHIDLFLVDVAEENPPKNKEAVRWRLLTTHAVKSVADAWQIVDWYKRRWVIEQFFRVLKSQGLQLEDSQLESADRLLKLAAIAAHAAVLTIQLTQARGGTIVERADIAFSESEIDALAEIEARQYRGKTALQRNPHPAFSIAWAAWIIARLGGWDGYPSSKPPGPITFKHGIAYFKAYATGYGHKDVCMP